MPPVEAEGKKTVLVANRGEIAIRLIRAVHACHLRAAAVYASDDSTSPHLRHADLALNLGDDSRIYTSIPAILDAAKRADAFAVLPGYGFLSENAEAAEAVEDAGLVWLGPTPDSIRAFGLKHTARDAAIAADVPVVPGSGLVATAEDAARAAEQVGFPALLKASAGGGGMGQTVVRDAAEVCAAFASVSQQATSLFDSADIFVERFVADARHVEVQVFGDGHGAVVALGDRDCSAQRRRQKVVEEAPAPGLRDAARDAITAAAVRLCAAQKYRSAGTVEFIVDATTHEFFFLEVNTRLQVEHGVTELVRGVDIPAAMIRLGLGDDGVLAALRDASANGGVAVQARLYAENPMLNFRPSSGTVSRIVWPDDDTVSLALPPHSLLRVDRWAETGVTVSNRYDPLLGKVMAWGRTRALALLALEAALLKTVVRGVDMNTELLLQIVRAQSFRSGAYTTRLLSTLVPAARAVEVLEPGLQSSLQDYPGRVGLWHVGVSPSGPMDAYAMGMANALVGNESGACALEITVAGPTLRFHCDAVVALTGGNFCAHIDDGRPVRMWAPFAVCAGSTLAIGKFRQSAGGDNRAPTGGKIAYLAVRGGFDAPKYLGSAATFPNGKFGGLTGGFLSSGDFLPVGVPLFEQARPEAGPSFRWPLDKPLDAAFIPAYNRAGWTVAALNGPHASAEFLQDESLAQIWSSDYTVQSATNRLGARLNGPTPKWTRDDGGSAGLHPSNLHDYTYAPGAVNFSGNTPIVLMLDGPSLGGFVCPITIASADLWKVAQAAPGETVRFQQVDFDQARKAASAMEEAWDCVRINDRDALERLMKGWSPWWIDNADHVERDAVLASLDPAKGDSAEIKVCYRMSGDEHILVEYGEIELDLAYRLRVHMVMEELKSKEFVKELCPGVRSVLIRFDRNMIHVDALVAELKTLESGVLGAIDDVQVPSRVLRLPLAFNDRWNLDAQERYKKSVRPDAPYMPSNVEFVRRINGLPSVDAVRDIMVRAEYMVLGLGDVYLGAPCAVPVDPRHRIVTSKYNPARTYTPEGSVGIGGAYMCIYGMESPGGYQLCGRTLPIWDSFGAVPERCRGSPPDVPWLLRFFDRVTFFLVSDDELEKMRASYRTGDYVIDIRQETFSYREHLSFLETNKDEIASFTKQRQSAYDEERASWEREGEGASDAASKHAAVKSSSAPGNDADARDGESEANMVKVTGGVVAQVWSVAVEEGAEVSKGDTLLLLESMKVEIAVVAPTAGVVRRIAVARGEAVAPDDTLCVIEASQANLSDVSLSTLASGFSLSLTTPAEVARNAMSRLFTGWTKTTEEALATAVSDTEKARAAGEYTPLYGAPFVSCQADSSVSAVSSAGALCIAQASDARGEACVAVRHGAATFALLGHTTPIHAAGGVALTLSDGVVEGGLIVIARHAGDAGRVASVCAERRSPGIGLREPPAGGWATLGRARAAKLRVGVLQCTPGADVLRFAARALEEDGHAVVTLASAPLDDAVRELTDAAAANGQVARVDWWRRAMRREVWASADVLLLGPCARTKACMSLVAQLDLCSLALDGIVIVAPALCEDALLAVADGLTSSS